MEALRFFVFTRYIDACGKNDAIDDVFKTFYRSCYETPSGNIAFEYIHVTLLWHVTPVLTRYVRKELRNFISIRK